MGKADHRRVVLGVCGSIAAYKACEIVRGLVKAGAEVRVVMTAAAERFVTPLTLSVLSRGPVRRDPFDPEAWIMAHLTLASWARQIVVAPATADFIARLAGGRASGLLEAVILAAKAPVALCPAMDAEMWEHAATRSNVARLRDYGYSFWGPERGPLASGRIGTGRLLAPEAVVGRTLEALGRRGPRRSERGGDGARGERLWRGAAARRSHGLKTSAR